MAVVLSGHSDDDNDDDDDDDDDGDDDDDVADSRVHGNHGGDGCDVGDGDDCGYDRLVVNLIVVKCPGA